MSDQRPRYSNLQLARRITLEAAPYWHFLLVIFLLELLATPLLLLTPVPLKIVVDSFLGHHPLPGFLSVLPGWLTGSGLVLLFVAAAMQLLMVGLQKLQELAVYVTTVRAGETMTMGFRSRLFRHLQALSLAFHDMRGSADSIYRIEYDAHSLQYLVAYGVIPAVTAMITLVTTILVIARIDWQLAAVAIAISPVLGFLSLTYDNRMRPRYRNVKQLESGALKVVQEVLGAVRVVKAFGREDSETQRFVRQSREGMLARIRLAFAESVYGGLINVTIALGTASVLVIGALHVRSGSLTLGSLLVVISYLTQLYAPLNTFATEVAGIQGSLASIERAFDLLDERPAVTELPHARQIIRARGQIELLDLHFEYEPGMPVLAGISLSLPAGTRLGVAGRTGAGKSTLASLLIRFYDPTSGRILLDGRDLREYRLADLRNQFAIVLQDAVLFSTSIDENIRYARAEATTREIVAAARAANVHEFIESLPDGYDTLVGERGMRLSGGERQRIALARAFLRDAPILIMDEPTSSVDMRTEAAILEAMQRLMSGRTTILIAHRLSTLKICDLAIELEHGRIVELVRSPEGVSPAALFKKEVV